MITTSVVTRDNGLFGRMVNTARRCTARVRVGYFANQGVHGGKHPITLGNLARIHEHGTARTPKRAFVAPALAKNQGKYLRLVGDRLTPMLTGRISPNQTWHYVGQQAVADVQMYMVQESFTPLSPKTIKAKGSSRPLIDTGQLRQSVTYKVKK